jgi:ABC-2 type transport system permease protein
MSSPIVVLARHSLRRMRPVLISLAIVVCGFQFLLTQVASYLFRSGGFSLMPSLVPDFLQQMAGPSMLTMMSFQGLVAFGYFHPMVLAAHVGLAIAIATEPVAEVETRFADLTLARPIARHQVITRTVVLLVATELVVIVGMMASTWTGLLCCTPREAPRPDAAVIRSLALMLGAVSLSWGGIALALASAANRRATASGTAAVAALAAFLLDYLGRIWDPARLVSRFSPFHYFEPMTVAAGLPPSVGDLVVLLTIAAAATAIAYGIFARRDV